MWRSPNGTIETCWRDCFREPIVCNNIQDWFRLDEPICIGDTLWRQIEAIDVITKEKGKLTITFEGEDGETQSHEFWSKVMVLPLVCTILMRKSRGLHSCFNVALKKMALYLSTKNTNLKI